MAVIKTLKQNGEQIVPRTVAEAVSTEAGSNVQVELDALKGQVENIDVSEQLKNYLPLTGGTLDLSGAGARFEAISPQGRLVIDEDGFYALAKKIESNDGLYNYNITCSKDSGVSIEHIDENMFSNEVYAASTSVGMNYESLSSEISTRISEGAYNVNIYGRNETIGKEALFEINFDQGITFEGPEPTIDTNLVTKRYVDTKIAAIPTPDVSAQIEAHNISATAHANMHWLTAEDEMLSSITPDGSIDADTLEGHPANYFATKDDLSTVSVDLSDYYTKTEVDAKITQIQQLIDQAAALVDEINGEVI